MEKALYTWSVDARARDVPITTTLVLEEKAKQFATALDISLTSNGCYAKIGLPAL